MLRISACAAMLGLALAHPAAAHETTSFDCGYAVEFEVTLSRAQVTLRDGEIRYALSGDRVFRNGRELALDAAGRLLAQQYRSGLEALVPALSDVALRGALLVIESLALVSAGLSGDASALTRAVEHIERLALRLHLEFDGRRLPAGNALHGAALEQEYEALSGQAVGGIADRIASFVARAVFDPEAAEARAEYLERLVERRIEPRAEALGKDAERICEQLGALDAIESRLGVIDAIRSEQTI